LLVNDRPEWSLRQTPCLLTLPYRERERETERQRERERERERERRRTITMPGIPAISDSQLAKALKKFFDSAEHNKAFEDLLFELYNRGPGSYVTWSDGPSNEKDKRLIVRVVEMAFSGGILNDNDHAIKVRPMNHVG
jgi:hypothetical protein